MQKAKSAFTEVAGKILIIAFGVQVFLGLIWMLRNFGTIQSFEETMLYLQLSETLICDEYEGILYPLFLRLTRGVEAVTGIPYQVPVYLVQVGAAFVASWKLLQGMGVVRKQHLLFGTLVMLTCPMAMQCHMAVTPDSLASTMLLLETAYAMEVFRGKKELHPGLFGMILLFWVLASLMRPEYRYFGGVSAVVLMSCELVRKPGKRIVRHVLLLAMAVVLIAGVRGLTQTEGALGRTRQSVELAMAGRCAWPDGVRDYGLWPEHLKEQITSEQAIEANLYADGMERVIGRSLEKSVGVETSKKYLWDIASVGWTRYTRQVATNVMWDVAGYAFSPIVVQVQFGGGGYESYTGRNYDIMSEHTPQWTEYYFNYGSWVFALGMVLAVCLCILRIRKGQMFWSVLFTCVGIVVWYSMRGAGMMDYKKSVFVTIMWITWMLLSVVTTGKQSSEKEQMST